MNNFKSWFETEGGAYEVKKMLDQARKEQQMKQINQQGGLGKVLHKQHGVWMLHFNKVKRDEIEGWYFDWHDDPGSVRDINDVTVGDKVADYSLNMTPYWTVGGIDEEKGLIYVTPIEPNPIATGKGAGGATWTQHDTDVQTGDYERKAIDATLKAWQAGKVNDITDVKYMLLGTVPVQMGPNLSQGGWYNAGDWHTRGAQKNMDAKEIMMADAKKLKDTFGLAVPKAALTGELDVYQWNQFVGGSTDRKDGTEVEGENWKSAHTMAKMVLTHPQPQIKVRNAEALVDHFMGDHVDLNDDDWETKRDDRLAMKKVRKEIEPLVKETAKKFSRIFAKNQDEYWHFDPYWHAKEKFILLAGRMRWGDVLRMYEHSPDATNRRFVLETYAGGYGGHKAGEKGPVSPEGMWRMLNNETRAENIYKFMYEIKKLAIKSGRYGMPKYSDPKEMERLTRVTSELIKWTQKNNDKIQKAIQESKEKGMGHEGEQLEKDVAELPEQLASYQKFLSYGQ